MTDKHDDYGFTMKVSRQDPKPFKATPKPGALIGTDDAVTFLDSYMIHHLVEPEMVVNIDRALTDEEIRMLADYYGNEEAG
jgi:hypothetical protein